MQQYIQNAVLNCVRYSGYQINWIMFLSVITNNSVFKQIPIITLAKGGNRAAKLEKEMYN